MTFQDDLDDDTATFFNPTEFAIIADYKIRGGATLGGIYVVVEQEVDPEGLENKGFRDHVYFYVKKADILVNPKFGDEVVVDSTVYTVEKMLTEENGVFYITTRRNERVTK